MSARSFRSEDWEKLAIKAEFRPARMAALCRISPKQLQRIFNEVFQKTPTRWMREFRCRLVLTLVAEGYTYKAIAAELHFASETHLCHDFRKAYPESPRKIAFSALSIGARR
jgi:AraC-like DNA-binding protein